MRASRVWRQDSLVVRGVRREEVCAVRGVCSVRAEFLWCVVWVCAVKEML